MIKTFIIGTITVIGLILGSLTIAGYFGKYGWHFDIWSHFRIFFLMYFIFCLIVTLKRSRILTEVWITLALLNILPILSLYVPETSKSQSNSKLQMMTINLESSYNRNFEKAAACIRTLNPDIVSLQEIDNIFAKKLIEKLPQYKYSKLSTADAFSGVGLLSKYPIKKSDIYTFGTNFPLIASSVETPIGDVLVLVAHPLAPYTPLSWQNQILFADGIKQICESNKGSIVLAGDLNTTPFSYQYQRLLNLTNLKDSNRGFGYQPTWHAPLAFIGIDHCLITKDLVAVARSIGSYIESDHLPLYVEISKSY